MGKRNHASRRRAKREYIFTRDSFTCMGCGWRPDSSAAFEGQSTGAARYLTIEHIVERGMGGTNHYSNLTTLCNECNSKKSERFARTKVMLMNSMRMNEDDAVELLQKWFDPDLIMWAMCV